MLAWRCEHRIRRREDLLFSFGSERGPFPKDGPGHLGRPSLSPAWRISPGSITLEDLESVSTTFFCRPCMDNSFRLLLLSRPCVDLDKHSFFCRFTGTVSARGTDTFSVLAHSFSPFVSHFDTHFYTSVTALAPCSMLCGMYTSYGTYACKTRDLKAADSGFHFGPCAVRFIH